MATDIREVDIIIAGGGTAACTLAGRLAKGDPILSILIIEGGRNNLNDPTVTVPAMFPIHLTPAGGSALFYVGKEPQMGNRDLIVTSGGILGGGSSINYMLYSRAQGIDFDSWNTPGWGQDDLLPLLKKAETYHIRGDTIDQSLHGHDGPNQISRGTFAAAASEDAFIKTIQEMGYPEIEDLQDLKSAGGFSRWARYISPEGKRQDAAHVYVHPLLADGQHPNLQLLVESKVSRVLFDESSPPKAIGVEYESKKDSLRHSVFAKKLVIVASGALGSPLILERSGVGNREILTNLGIPVVVDLPGVGDHYQDHPLLFYPYKTTLAPKDTLDGFFQGRDDFGEGIARKDPRMGWNGIDICSKLRFSSDDLASLPIAVQDAWAKDFADTPSKPIALMGSVNAFVADPSTFEPGQYFQLGAFTAYPYSRGHIHVSDPQDLHNGYDFHTGFHSDPQGIDLAIQVWAYKKNREIMRRVSFYNGELQLGHPTFPEGSDAAVPSVGVAEAGDAKKDLKYTAEDDKAIEEYLSKKLTTSGHSLGTCPMRPRENGGVVDHNLDVYGTSGLKVVDMSIVPENVAANTHNTAVLVGEKAALIVGKALGISV